MVGRAKDWLKQAERNLKSAEVNLINEIYEEACFEAHQAAEKAIKALLNVFHKEVRGHSIIYLARTLNIEIPAEIYSCMQWLDKHYIPSRYPDVYNQGIPADYYNKDDAGKCLECAKKIVNWVKNVGNL